MSIISLIMAVFSVLGAADLIIGNKFGIGGEFKKGLHFFGDLALSMIGMIILAPFIGELISPVSSFLNEYLHIDPSILPSMLFANDMGGAALAKSVAINKELGLFNGLVVASMMGCTLSFTIPYALNVVEAEKQRSVLLGFLCGIATIPIGLLLSGLIIDIKPVTLLIDIIPVIALAFIISVGLVLAPRLCVKLLGVLGLIIKTLIIIGLTLGIIRFLTGVEIINGLEKIEVGAEICFNASIALTGVFPFMFILSRIIKKPIKSMGKALKINEEAAFGLFSTLAVSMTTFDKVKEMDDKGTVLNSAFAVSAAFLLADHLAFTMAFNPNYILPVSLGKIVSGASAVALAAVIYKRGANKNAD